jgi:hypothetical protein
VNSPVNPAIESVELSSPLRIQPLTTGSPRYIGVSRLTEADTPVAALKIEADIISTGNDFISPSNDLSNATMSNGHGAIASGVPVQLIFWGAGWNLPTTSPSAGQIVTAVQSILAGPFMSGLVQYGVDRSPYRGAIIVSAPAPALLPHTFSQSDVEGLVNTLIGDGRFPEPDEDGGRIIYMVIMPPNSNYEGDASIVGAHGVFSSGSITDVDHAWFAWIGNHNIDIMTRTVGHELAETCTDPEGDGWTVDGQPDGLNEIGDICNKSFQKLNGVMLEAYWSKVDGACLLPTAYSVKRFMLSKGLDPVEGLRSHVLSGGSVRRLMGI